MTEFWKSHKMHWCDVCKCWLNDTKQAIAHHEAGMGHKANLARKIREMGKKAEEEKRQQETAAKTLSQIEKQAAAKFERDKQEAEKHAAAAQAAEEARSGVWEWDTGCSYYYNEKHRWYYDPKTKWYYGGEPTPEWKELPPIPSYAMFGTARHSGGPVPQPAQEAAGTSAKQSTAGPSAAVAAGVTKAVTHKVVLELPKHPQAMVGGHQAPTDVGRVGTAKGVGSMAGKPITASAAKAPAQAATSGDKRKREEALTPAETEARAKREAARQRVAARTAQSFGFL